jgi:tetratricopeptide (TPR) repeat protein
MAGGVFINYRGDDCRSYAALLYAELSHRFGTNFVFLDNVSITAGSDFVSHLLQRVCHAWIVLALIGPDWVTATNTGGFRRLDDPDDWTRRELAEAFAAGRTVIPVLTDDAAMPAEHQLPRDIAQLSRCQFRRLRHREARFDIARLATEITDIEPRLTPRNTAPTGPVLVGRPPLRADAFQERPVLRDAFAGNTTTDRTATMGQVITGDGGTGKTQLAAAAFAAALRDVDIAVWINARTRSDVVATYARAYAAVRSIVPTQDEGEAEQQATNLLGWLATTGQRWLIVLDDVADPADLRGLWPSGTGGRVIVTTRRRDAELLARGQVVDVNTFRRTESLAYLAAKLNGVAGMPAGVLDDADGLAADLGDLPLALSHATATIINDGIRCRDYRTLFASGAHRLNDVLPSDPADAGDDYVYPVSSTWSLARDRADRLRPAGLAGPMLDVIAVLDPNGIPETVLTGAPMCRYLTAGDATVARQAIRNLWRLSLVTHDPIDPVRSVRMHALAQRANIERMPPDATAHAVRVAADALVSAWPAIDAGTALGQALRANAATLIERHPTALWRTIAHPVLFRMGGSLADSGLIAGAMAYCTELAAAAAQHLGTDHPDALRARYHLAGAHSAAGDLAAAGTAYRELLADQARVLGADHADTLTTRADLGWWQGTAGDPSAAVAAFRDLLADRTRVLGRDHRDTLFTRNCLARWRARAGSPAEAIETFEHLLRDECRLLGAHHPDTLATRNNLAYVRGKAGDPRGALAEIEQVLAGRIRLLGPDHPRTLTTRAHLARWRGEAGDATGAAAAFADILADELRVLGLDHPRTCITRACLARWRGEAGDATGAVAALEGVLADRYRLLGDDHPDTVETRQDLGHWRRRCGVH